jgi:hypothetical protein
VREDQSLVPAAAEGRAPAAMSPGAWEPGTLSSERQAVARQISRHSFSPINLIAGILQFSEYLSLPSAAFVHIDIGEASDI